MPLERSQTYRKWCPLDLCERGWLTIRQRLHHHATVAPVVRAPSPKRFSRCRHPTNTLGHTNRHYDWVLQAETRLDEAIQAARPAMRAVSETRELASEEHVVEFGIKLKAEAGVVVAKTPAEGHFIVKITWMRDTTSEE